MGLDASGLILDGYGPIWKDSVSIQDYFGPKLDESGPIWKQSVLVMEEWGSILDGFGLSLDGAVHVLVQHSSGPTLHKSQSYIGPDPSSIQDEFRSMRPMGPSRMNLDSSWKGLVP